MMRYRAVWTVLLSIMLCVTAARAGIVVQIGEAADKDSLFWVETRSNHALIHGGYTTDIDARLMRPGETAEISVLALNPITFSFVHTSIYHPAHLYDSK